MPADKGGRAVVLDAADCDTEILRLPSDAYEKLRRDPAGSYDRKATDLLRELEKGRALDTPPYYRLDPGKAIPCVYGLPKIRKRGTPLGPMASNVDPVAYRISKDLASVSAPAVGDAPRRVGNSRDFAKKVSGLKLRPEEIKRGFCRTTASRTERP